MMRASMASWRFGCLAIVLTAGCFDPPDLDTWYGARSGPLGGSSVNGTAVLADMFTNAGHTVLTRKTLTPGLMETADVIVWIPDEFEAPNEHVVEWLWSWCWEPFDRTLIYVGRDFDAAEQYWAKAQPLAPSADQAEFARRASSAKTDFVSERSAVSGQIECDWFVEDHTTASRQVRNLEGPWSQGIDASKVEIELHSRMTPAEDFETLLSSSGDAIVARKRYAYVEHIGATPEGETKIILVSNGSFLLNLPLVNHEHRKLAGKLIAEVGSAKRVVFLESGTGGPPIRDRDPRTEPPSGLAVLGVWPLSAILLHLSVLGMIFFAARWPLFGPPRDPPRESTSDFGKHISALGELLQISQDREFAQARLVQYHRTARTVAESLRDS